MIRLQIILNKSNSLGYPSPDLVLELYNLEKDYIKVQEVHANDRIRLRHELDSFETFKQGYLADLTKGILYKNSSFIYIDPLKFDDFRVCPDAIRLVKELAFGASGKGSNLQVRVIALQIDQNKYYECIDQHIKDV